MPRTRLHCMFQGQCAPDDNVEGKPGSPGNKIVCDRVLKTKKCPRSATSINTNQNQYNLRRRSSHCRGGAASNICNNESVEFPLHFSADVFDPPQRPNPNARPLNSPKKFVFPANLVTHRSCSRARAAHAFKFIAVPRRPPAQPKSQLEGSRTRTRTRPAGWTRTPKFVSKKTTQKFN